MKIIHTSDWHIGKTLCDYPLLEDQSWFLDWFLSEMERERPDVILIAGDLYDRSVPSGEAVELLDQALVALTGRLGIPVVIIAGNHDSRERLSFGSHLMEHSGLYLVGKPEGLMKTITLTDRLGQVDFTAIPYLDCYDIRPLFPNKILKTTGDAFAALTAPLAEGDPARRRVLVAHGFFGSGSLETSDGTQVGGSEIISLSPLSRFDYLALGHLHGARTAGLPHARYSGSPLKYSVDEAAQKKLYHTIILNEKGNPQITATPIPCRRDVRTLTGAFAELMNRDTHQNRQFEDYVFVSLTDRQPIPDVMNRLKALFPNVLGVQFPQYTSQIFRPQGNVKQLEEKSTQELFADFYEKSTGEGLTDTLLRRVDQTAKKLAADSNKQEETL